jgi:hypothetical protein
MPLDYALQKLIHSNAQTGVQLSTCIPADQERLSQRFAYFAMLYTVGMDGNTDWYDDTNECQWTGVTTRNSNQRITGFALANSGLVGSIPADVGLWSNLESFDAHSNPGQGFGGNLPSSLSRWTKLQYFDISDNLFSGTISSSLGAWTNIQHFDVRANAFSGTMPKIGNNFCPLGVAGRNLWADCKAPAEISCGCCNKCCDSNGANCVSL